MSFVSFTNALSMSSPVRVREALERATRARVRALSRTRAAPPSSRARASARSLAIAHAQCSSVSHSTSLAVVLACAFAGERMKTSKLGRALSGPVSAMALGALAANVGAFGDERDRAIVFDSLQHVQKIAARLATPMLLFGADLRQTFASTRGLAAPFIVGAFATTVGCFVAVAIVFGASASGDFYGLKDDAWKLAAALAAKNIGGGLNYVAVATTLGMSSSAFIAGVACDNIFALVYFPFVSYLANRYNVENAERTVISASDSSTATVGSFEESPATAVGDVLACAFASCALLALGERISPNAVLPATTALTVAFATMAPKSMSKSLATTGRLLGDSLLFGFFVVAGACGSSLEACAPSILAFLFVVYAVHLGIVIAASRTIIPVREALLASNACIGGPATAAALATSARWFDLLVPGVLAGQLGNAIATFIGLALSAWFRTMLSHA